ncbi:ribokinase [Neobacillus sp. PS2-9]|uniref:ribokinase n=1 Tax=Neobacillus sp. PS2-9 TaxID=3070676 RepID=UPI0027DECA81|nr:ribokinase [Neobacillus sp. PS2-9]WML57827.1 ribokinase [Neobacillus sp. PS2-9]
MKKPIITVIGSLNMDLVTVTDRTPLQGETITGQSFSTYPGGKGANQAVAAARLGAEVHMLGKVGKDLFGTKLKEVLQQEGVNEESVEIATIKETGTASIIISGQDNRIIVVPGANSEVTPEWVIAHEETIINSNLLLLQLEIPLDSVIKITEIANKYQVPVILNPAPYQKLPKKLIDGVTYLTPNKHEYSQLLDEASGEEKDQIIAKSIVTKGEDGVEFQFHNQRITLNGVKVEVVDTTGAGDTFNGALAVELSKNKNLKDAVLFATMAATISVTKMGAQTGMPYVEELEKFYELNASKLVL